MESMKSKYIIPFKAFSVLTPPAPFHNKAEFSRYCIDFALPEGTPIIAARAGTVVYTESRFSRSFNHPKYRNKGNVVIIKHTDEEETWYAHLKWRSIKVDIGQKVRQGQIIGYSGSTGFASYPHLHFGVYDEYGANKKITFPGYTIAYRSFGPFIINSKSY